MPSTHKLNDYGVMKFNDFLNCKTVWKSIFGQIYRNQFKNKKKFC